MWWARTVVFRREVPTSHSKVERPTRATTQHIKPGTTRFHGHHGLPPLHRLRFFFLRVCFKEKGNALFPSSFIVKSAKERRELIVTRTARTSILLPDYRRQYTLLRLTCWGYARVWFPYWTPWVPRLDSKREALYDWRNQAIIPCQAYIRLTRWYREGTLLRTVRVDWDIPCLQLVGVGQ